MNVEYWNAIGTCVSALAAVIAIVVSYRSNAHVAAKSAAAEEAYKVGLIKLTKMHEENLEALRDVDRKMQAKFSQAAADLFSAQQQAHITLMQELSKQSDQDQERLTRFAQAVQSQYEQSFACVENRLAQLEALVHRAEQEPAREEIGVGSSSEGDNSGCAKCQKWVEGVVDRWNEVFQKMEYLRSKMPSLPQQAQVGVEGVLRTLKRNASEEKVQEWFDSASECPHTLAGDERQRILSLRANLETGANQRLGELNETIGLLG
jgi:hypothetical protein